MSNLAIKTNYFDHLYNAKEELRIKRDKEAEARRKAEEEAKKQQQEQNNPSN